MAVLSAEVRARNALVGVGCLLHNDLLVARLAGAAADGDEPEETGSDGEGDADPEDGEHLVAHRGLDLVGFEDGLEDADEGGVQGGGGDGCGQEEDSLRLESVSWELWKAI